MNQYVHTANHNAKDVCYDIIGITFKAILWKFLIKKLTANQKPQNFKVYINWNKERLLLPLVSVDTNSVTVIVIFKVIILVNRLLFQC